MLFWTPQSQLVLLVSGTVHTKYLTFSMLRTGEGKRSADFTFFSNHNWGCTILTLFSPVFRIPDILVRIPVRIRILGSIPLTNGSGSGSCSFRQWPSRCQQIFPQSFLLLFDGTFTSFFTDKKKSQNSRNQGFSCHFCLMMGGPLINGSGPGGPKNYGSGSGSGTLVFSLVTRYLLLAFVRVGPNRRYF